MNPSDTPLPESLIRTLRHTIQNSPFYKKRLHDSGLDFDSIKTLTDFRSIPVTTKQDLSQDSSRFIASPGPFREWVTTSGTSTQPIAVPLTPKDMMRLALNEELALSAAGISADDTVLLAVAMDRLFIAGMAYYSGASRIGATVLRCGAASVDLVLKALEQFQPTAIIGVPSFLVKVGREIRKRELSRFGSSIRRIIAIGEPVARADHTRNHIGSTLEQLWDAKVLSTYASTEMATSFCECPFQKGGHYLSGLVFLEILDEQRNSVSTGQAGEVVVTPLGIEGFPLLRYATGDIARFDPYPCDCGYLEGRLRPILGRKSQMLKIKGTTVFLSSILDALASQELIREYFLVIENESPLSDRLLLCASLESGQNESALSQSLENYLKGILKFMPDLRWCPSSEIIELQKTRGSKKRFFEDRRKSPSTC